MTRYSKGRLWIEYPWGDTLDAWQKVSGKELVASGSLASAEICAVVPENMNVYPDSEDIRVIWGEEMVLELMVSLSPKP